MASPIVIDVARDFSAAPGARHRNEGAFSGEAFLHDHLVPRLRDAISSGVDLVVILDGALGYASSFLEEAFGGLARIFDPQVLRKHLRIVSEDDPLLVQEVERYMGLSTETCARRLEAAAQQIDEIWKHFETSTLLPLTEVQCRSIVADLKVASRTLAELIAVLGVDGEDLPEPLDTLLLTLKHAMTSGPGFPSDGFQADATTVTRARQRYDQLAAALSMIRRRIRVFISYTHETAAHKGQVLALAQRLRSDGLDCQLDQFVNGSPPEGWVTWMARQLARADYVLVVCTETYQRRFEKNEASGVGLGATWESVLALQDLYEGQGVNRKYVPVSFDGRQYVPKPLRAFTQYRMTDDYDALFRHMTDQPEVVAVAVGPRRVLPPKA